MVAFSYVWDLFIEGVDWCSDKIQKYPRTTLVILTALIIKAIV